MFKFEQLESELQKQLSLYVPEFYRIVDVDTYEVLDYRHGEFIDINQKCYQVWNMNAPCMTVSYTHLDVYKRQSLTDEQIAHYKGRFAAPEFVMPVFAVKSASSIEEFLDMLMGGQAGDGLASFEEDELEL